MAGMRLATKLEDEYRQLYDTIEYTVPMQGVSALAESLVRHQGQYRQVELGTKAPWLFVGIAHLMESGGRFTTHLHNGDPLNERTLHVPAGRPKRGEPPFDWHVSASDAIKMRSWPHEYMSLPRMLFYFERWNGWGYRRYHPEVLSPYLWSGSQHYDAGKYGSDGVFSENLRSRQIGAAVILRRFVEMFEDDLPDWLAVGRVDPEVLAQFGVERPWVFNSDFRDPMRDLQRLLNTWPEIHIAVDGQAGPKTSDAFKLATGHYLQGDPREG